MEACAYILQSRHRQAELTRASAQKSNGDRELRRKTTRSDTRNPRNATSNQAVELTGSLLPWGREGSCRGLSLWYLSRLLSGSTPSSSLLLASPLPLCPLRSIILGEGRRLQNMTHVPKHNLRRWALTKILRWVGWACGLVRLFFSKMPRWKKKTHVLYCNTRRIIMAALYLIIMKIPSIGTFQILNLLNIMQSWNN